jgi:hypothetical protein
MCLIVDTNVAHKILLRIDDPDFKDVHARLFAVKQPAAVLVYGGRLAREYAGNDRIRRVVLALERNGAAIRVSDNLVEGETAWAVASGLCRSDDPHIIGLARAANVRLLCSHDRELHTDFTNGALLGNPRGKVFQTRRHRPLLREFCG